MTDAAPAPSERVPVVIIGAGPTGLTAATLLAQYGVECLLLDRRAGIHPLPRGVHLDDEVVRVLARLGLAGSFAAISRPMRGLRLVDADRRPLAEFTRPDAVGRHGFPQANLFDQPELEALLSENLARWPAATLRTDTEVIGLTEAADGTVRVQAVDRTTGAAVTLAADHVLGCDGAHSLVRDLVGARLRDLGFEQRWLVVDVQVATDVAAETDLLTWDGVHQVCDRVRPATFMRVGERRYRWEFRLNEGETAAQFADLDRLSPLLRPWTGRLPIERVHLIRAAEYTFRAAVADRWRRGRVLLLGDAAHLLPPFTGQGMGAGIRDAHNLAWKLVAVRQGRLPESVLDSYQQEREPHVRSLIRLAKIVGSAMSAGGRLGDLLRTTAAPRFRLVPGLRARVADSTTPPLHRSALVRRRPLGGSPAGSLCPNVLLPDGGRFDQLVDGRFAVVTIRSLTAAQRRQVERAGAVPVTGGRGSELGRWLRRHRVAAAVVRPDFTVSAAGLRVEPLLRWVPSEAAAEERRRTTEPAVRRPPIR